MLVAPKKRCKKPSYVVENVDNYKCHHTCKNMASMFAFGSDGGCTCEMTAIENKICEPTDDDAFDLYRINNGIQISFVKML